MTAPRANNLFTSGGSARGVLIGLQLDCPDCPSLLRFETASDYPAGKCPEIVGHAGGLGFVVRCDGCGCRIEMKGSRLARVDMLENEGGNG